VPLFTATTTVAQDLAQGLAEAINNTYLTYGYFASVGVESVTVYYNSSVGSASDYAALAAGTGAANITVPATLSDGTGGSVELEWSETYHIQICSLILEKIGVSLKAEQLQAYVERICSLILEKIGVSLKAEQLQAYVERLKAEDKIV